MMSTVNGTASQDPDPQIRAAHVSGKYLIAATIIGGLFGLGVSLTITISLRPKREIVYVERYDRTADLKLDKSVQKDVAKARLSSYVDLIDQEPTDRVFFADHRFQDSNLHLRFMAFAGNRLNDGNDKVLVTTLDSSPIGTRLVSPGEEWEIMNGYKIVITKLWLWNEQLYLSARLYKQEPIRIEQVLSGEDNALKTTLDTTTGD